MMSPLLFVASLPFSRRQTAFSSGPPKELSFSPPSTIWPSRRRRRRRRSGPPCMVVQTSSASVQGPDDDLGRPRPVSSYSALFACLAASALVLLLMVALDGRLARFKIRERGGALVYKWVRAEAGETGYLTAWAGYLTHQVGLWACIARAKSLPERRAAPGLRGFNWAALAVNGAGVALHLVQTHVWYDGLARGTPELLALGAVAVLLVWVMVMESGRRGIAFGRGRHLLRQDLVRFARDTHPWFFSWACVWNFWFHPCLGHPAFIIGFAYKFLLLAQASLMLTAAHLNRWWRLLLETFVIVHGAATPLLVPHQRTAIWAMFFGGFLATFVANQLHDPLFRAPRLLRLTLTAIFGAAALLFLARVGPAKSYLLTAVPLCNLLIFASLALVLFAARAIRDRLFPGAVPGGRPAEMEPAQIKGKQP